MKIPKVRFVSSATRDFETLLAFVKDAKYDQGRNLEWAIFKKYPKLKIFFDHQQQIKDKKALKSFVAGAYQKDQKQMRVDLNEHAKRWKNVAPQFFILVSKLFTERVWPRGRYVAYGTIWGMYPRFLENKTFQIPYRHRFSNYVPVVIAHEMLHFMFYDYFYQRYPKYNKPEKNFFVWHISEIFNTLIQNSPEWLRYFKRKSMGYPEHEKIVEKLGHKWYRKNTWDLDVIVDQIVKEVQANGLDK